MNVNNYLTGLSNVVSSLIGSKLSSSNTQGGGTKPSVFVARQKPPKPSYPYSLCDYIGVNDIGFRELHREFDGVSETSYFNKRLRLRVALYGSYEDDILSTTEELKNRLSTPNGQLLMTQYMSGAGLMAVSETQFSSSVLSTDYEEFASLIIDFWVISKVSDEVGEIESAELGGTLYQSDYEQEEQPLTINKNII